MNYSEAVMTELTHLADKKKAEFFPRFFKTLPGEYAEGDQFIGVTVPNQRKIAKKFFREIPLAEVKKLLRHKIHEHRLTSLFIMVFKYQKAASEAERESIIKLYLENTDYVNNWDLVDSSADKILGPHLFKKDKTILYEFAKSNDLWKNRIAIITTLHFIKNNQFSETLKIASLLLNHHHDLIRKAVGWMLREIGNRDFETEYNFLVKNYKRMPRTMLRYAIEKFDEDMRQDFLKGTI